MPFLLPDPIRKLRLRGIQKHLAEHKEDGNVVALSRAVKLMLEDDGFRNHVARTPALKKPVSGESDLMNLSWAFLYHLLYAKDFVAAAMILFDEETFTAEPHCVQLVWNALMTKRMICVIGGGGLGKCLGPEVEVLMFDGRIKLAKDVVVGDVLMGDDGKPRNVLQANPGRGPMYRIIPERGEPWTCNGDHILTLRAAYDKKNGHGGGIASHRRKGYVVDVPIHEYIGWATNRKKQFLAYHVGVEFSEQPVPFDPYVYGAWLGDGGWDIPAIHKPLGPITERWSEYFASIGYRISVGYEDTPCPMISARMGVGRPNPFTNFIRTSVRDKEKFIREDYLRNSRENRMKLLAGLLDTDGSPQGTGFILTSKWESLARQVCWLARSLGFAATVRTRIGTIKSIGFSATYWVVYISGHGITKIPTLQKRVPESVSVKSMTNTAFKVEPIGDGDFYGFVIDGNRRFLLGDFTVTHNTYSTCAYFFLEWLTDPLWTRVQVASNSKDHLEKNAWADLVRLHSGASMDMPGKPDTVSISLEKKRSQGIFSLILPGGPESKGKLKGAHTKPRPEHPKFGRRSRVFCLIDEAQETAQNIFGEIPNRFSTVDGDDVEHIKFALTANPKSMFSEFGACAKPKVGGWDGITRADETWESEAGWTVVSLDAMKHENVVQRRKVFPGFVSWDGVQARLARCHGNWEDPEMWSYVFGKFPPLGLAQTVIKQNWLTAAEREWIFDSQTVGKFGGDPAFTGDRPTAATGRVGRAIGWIDYNGDRHTLAEPAMKIQVDAVAVVNRGDSQDLGDQYMERASALNIEPGSFGMDMTGAGRGTHDIVRRQWNAKVKPLQDGSEVANIIGIEYGSSPTTVKVADEDTATPKEMYNIIASELWFGAAKLFEFDVIGIGKGVDVSVFAELAARHGGMEVGLGKKLRVESKIDFKKRTGMKSPDLADATLIMIHVARITTPGLIPRAKDTTAPREEPRSQVWGGFNQSLAGANIHGMAGAGQLADMTTD